MAELDGPGDDYGLFGPGSVTWRIMGEPVLIVGGIRALLLQALHPQAMWGTAQNSQLMNPNAAWRRLARTVEFVRVRTYGTTEEAERAGRRVRRMHARMTGLNLRPGRRSGPSPAGCRLAPPMVAACTARGRKAV